MKRLIVLLLVLSVLPCGIARAGGVGVGIFGGMTYPMLQQDAGNGRLLGVRAPLHVVPFLAVEPWYASTSLSDKVTTVAGVSYTAPGFDEKVYGLNVMFAMGGPLSFYPLVGIGRATLSGSGFSKDVTSYNGGFGMSVSPVPKVSLDLRGEMQAVVDGGTTRKFGNATLGLTYSLFSLP